MRGWMIAGLLGLAACAAPGGPVVDGDPGGAAWRCDAEDARSLIGTHFGAVTFPTNANVRFVCTECAMTRDYRPDRLTLLYDRDTGIIQEVRCV